MVEAVGEASTVAVEAAHTSAVAGVTLISMEAGVPAGRHRDHLEGRAVLQIADSVALRMGPGRLV